MLLVIFWCAVAGVIALLGVIRELRRISKSVEVLIEIVDEATRPEEEPEDVETFLEVKSPDAAQSVKVI